MKFQKADFSLSRYLAKRLLPGTLVIALLISIVFPATYYVITYRAAERTATMYANEFSEKIYEFMTVSPVLWKYQIQKYIKAVHEFISFKDVMDIHVSDEKGERITNYDFTLGEHTETQHLSDLKGTAPIVYNNRVIGAVEVYISGNSILRSTFLIFLISLSLGTGLALFAYLFPVRVVKKAESIIRESEEQYRNIFDNARDIIFTVNKDALYTSVNPAFEKSTGWSREEILGKSFVTLVHPDDLPNAFETLNKVIQGELVELFELRARKKTGEYFICELTVAPVKKGDTVNVLGLARDITERKKIEEALMNVAADMENEIRERTHELTNAYESLKIENETRKQVEEVLKASEEKYRTLVNEINEGLFTTDSTGRFIFSNRAHAKMLGYENVEELTGKNVMDHIALPDRTSIAELFNNIDTAKIPEIIEAHMIKKDGSSAIFEVRATAIEKEGGIAGTRGIVSDITERKKAEEELRDAIVEAHASNKAKSDFLANISHELTTPLNSVIGFSQILQDGFYGEMNDNQKEYVDNILQSGTRLLSLIRSILDFARADSGRDEISVSRILLKDALRSSAAIFNEQSIKHNLKLTIDIEPDADIEIETDSGKLTRILYNLIDNAIKFTPDGGSVFVKARKLNSSELRVPSSESRGIYSELSTLNSQLHGSFIEISVEDTGIGIKPENIDKLFQPFAQLESPYTKSHGGTGIGLILTKKLVELLGGRIWVESEYGKGSRFTFLIPVRQKQNSESRSQESE